MKTLDSNHLVGVGVEGFYGASSPARLADNPAPSLNSNANGGSPAPYAAICEGQDFSANHAPQACFGQQELLLDLPVLRGCFALLHVNHATSRVQACK